MLALIGPVVTFGTIRSLLRVILFIVSLPVCSARSSSPDGIRGTRALRSDARASVHAELRGDGTLIAEMLVRGSARFRPFAGMTRIRF